MVPDEVADAFGTSNHPTVVISESSRSMATPDPIITRRNPGPAEWHPPYPCRVRQNYGNR